MILSSFPVILDIFVITRSEMEMSEVFDKLMESLFEVLATVADLETTIKNSRTQHEQSNHTRQISSPILTI